MGRDACATVVGGAAEAARATLASIRDPTVRRGARWSAAMYVWHLVDVVRIGTERLLTLRLDPAAGIPCWDENALAEARRYDRLSPPVGLVALDAACRSWLEGHAGT